MWKNTITLLALTVPLAPALAVELPDEATYHPDQRQPPAGLEHLYAYRPACRQLDQQPSDAPGWTAWGLKDRRGQFMQWYGLEDFLPDSEAYGWLEAAGLCVKNGAIVELISPVERDRLLVEANAVPEAMPGAPVATASTAPTGDNPFQANRERASQLLNAGASSAPTGDGGFVGLLMLVTVIGGLWAGHPFISKFMLRVRELAQEWEPFEDNEPSAERYEPAVVPSHDRLEAADSQTAVEILLRSPSVSRAIYGGQRSGKTNLVAVVTRQLAEQGWSIYHLNLGAYFGGEVDEDAHYWAHAVRSVKADLLIADEDEAEQAVEDSLALIDAYLKDKKDSIIVVDEWKFVTNKANQYAALLEPVMTKLAGIISGLDSNGVKRFKTIWTIAPGIVAGSMTDAGKSVKNLGPVLVAVNPAKAVDWQGQTITFSYPCFDQVNNNLGVTIPPPQGNFAADRICFIDDKWRPLGGAELSADLPQAQQANVVEGVSVGVPASHQETFVEEGLYPGLSAFLNWLEEKRGAVINYEAFHAANRFKETGRSRSQFVEYCDAAVMKGLIIPKANDKYFVLP
ncbi:hypothetical protein [Halomicronema sp. CCY15110]|uniref:hypothetical protein n=1 Tax=Halomicronema sp. CCY15110 TaxID=2767773 RepID=UPI00195080CE|nr:hypothetical protein [Halomicronema sp. CCY15110]